MTIGQDELDLAPDGKAPQPPQAPKSRKELLEAFDKTVTEARAAISRTSDADFMKPWTLLKTGQKLMTMPKAGGMAVPGGIG